MIRQHLALDVIDVAQHPKFGNAPVAYREEPGTRSTAMATDRNVGCSNAESLDTNNYLHPCPMGAAGTAIVFGGGAVLRRDQEAAMVRQVKVPMRRVRTARHGDDEAVRPAQLRPERGAEDEIRNSSNTAEPTASVRWRND